MAFCEEREHHMPHTTRIDRYTCHFYASRDDDDLVVYLYDEDATARAEVRFVAEPRALPAPSLVDGRRRLYYRRAAFPEPLDLLRNEGPIFLCPREDGSVTLSSAFEPVGEGERV
jgi:hypothetical protein